jgi:hypothetical protein
LFAGVKDTIDKLFTGVNNTADKFSPIMNCIDDWGLFFHQIGTNRWYLRPPKLDKAADGVIGTAKWKVASIGTPHILIRGPWGRRKYFKPKRPYLVLAASGASDNDVQLFMAVPMTPSAAMSKFGGWKYHRFVGGDNDTGEKFIIRLVVTGDHFSAVSTTPVINLSSVSTTPPIKENPWQRLIAGVNDTADKFVNSLSSVSLTSLINIHSRLSRRIFEKKSKWS